MMGNEAAALVSAALAARKNAYVPYSGYPVGRRFLVKMEMYLPAVM